jgi:hypothetical protein
VPDLGWRVDGAAPSNLFLWCFPSFSGLCEGVYCHVAATFLLDSCHVELAGNVYWACWGCSCMPLVNGRTSWHHMSGVLAVAGRPARGRSRSSVSAFPDALALLPHRPTVLLSSAQLPYTAHKRLWMLTTLSFSWTKNSITARCLKRESATEAILIIHYSSAICRNDSRLVMRAGETSDFNPGKLQSLLMTEKNNVGQSFLNNLRANKSINKIIHAVAPTFRMNQFLYL